MKMKKLNKADKPKNKIKVFFRPKLGCSIKYMLRKIAGTSPKIADNNVRNFPPLCIKNGIMDSYP
jgi:hypothetical protein